MPRHERRVTVPLSANEVVRNYRLLREWSQEFAAAEWGVSVRTWRRWESPGAYVPPALLKHIWRWAIRTRPEHRPNLSF